MTYRHARKPRPVGRPPLPSTRWLAAQLRRGGDAWAHFDAWRAEHDACMGYPCRQPNRSFRAALKVAERMAT